MIELSYAALALIKEKNAPLSIAPLQSAGSCCFEITECPAVSFGEPKQRADYTTQTVQGVTVYVPSCFPDEGSYVINVSNFFGFKRLVIDGWKLA